MIGEGRDLRQVRDAQHLVAAGERAELASHHLGHRAADAGVDLVEDHGRRVGVFERE